jgi:hypothetical protein
MTFPSGSLPIREISTVGTPSLANCAAWFPALPPGASVNRFPITDEPGVGIVTAEAIRSVWTLPTTVTYGRSITA